MSADWLKLDWVTIYGSVAAGTIAILIRNLVAIVVQQPIRLLANRFWMVKRASRLLPWFLKDRVYSGEWEITWSVESANFPAENRDQVELYKFLRFIAAEIVSTTTDDEKIAYGFVGEIQGNILSGRWFDTRDDRMGYYGSFQLVMARTLGKAEGKWLGFSQRGGVNAGPLLWQRIRKAQC